MDINWSAVSIVFGLIGGLSAIVFIVVRARLSGVFVTRDEHQVQVNRIDALDARLQQTPSVGDLSLVRDQVSGLSREVGALGARIDGVRDTGKRTEHMVEMMLMRQLERETQQ